VKQRGLAPTTDRSTAPTLELARERGYEEVARLLDQAIEKRQAAEKGKP
jgi:hypothetical protein